MTPCLQQITIKTVFLFTMYLSCKYRFLWLIILALPSYCFGQTQGILSANKMLVYSSSATANVNVSLSTAMTVTVKELDSTDALVSKSIDGKNNVKLENTREVKVTTAGERFMLKVGARNDLQDVHGIEIPISNVFVSSAPSDASDNTGYIYNQDVNVSKTEAKPLLYSEVSGTLNTSFKIEYYAKDMKDVDLSNANLDGTIVYTIELY